MICGGIGTIPSSANSAPVNKPNVSGAIPSACMAAFGRGSNVTGNFAARSRNGFGNCSSVASVSLAATALNFFQLNFTPEIWSERCPMATTQPAFFLALERRRSMVV
jgi:hypothetical protein